MDQTDRPRLYVFGWPSQVGGADTKLVHLLKLLHRSCLITVVPNHEERLHERQWIRYFNQLGVHSTVISRLPKSLSGICLALSNTIFFKNRIAHRAKEKGLKIVWSSEMMWHHEGELDAVREGIIDHVLYVSHFQRETLGPGYCNLPGTITGNYIDADDFPFKERRNATFTIGRLSRPAPEKYPEDFPTFYEQLSLPDTRFRVMAWSDELAKKYRWYSFDRRWDLVPVAKESQIAFLHTLDLFVYPLGHRFRESWGRSVVEAMLSGAVPIVPRGHHFENLLINGETGFLCDDFEEWRTRSLELRMNYGYRTNMAKKCREHAATNLCNADEHRNCWMKVFATVLGEL